MTMRLNLDHILRNQVMDQRQHGEPISHPMGRSSLRLGAGKSDAYKYLAEKGNVGSRVNTMISSIHQHMKTTAPPRKSVPAVPAPIAQIPVEASPSKTSARKTRRIKGGGGGAATVVNNKAMSMPLSRMKARITQKAQQVMRRGYVDLNPSNFTNQRRIREVLMQKSVLENMLLQHKRLQRDRQTIALDIQRMRQDLDKIKNKLDTSMEALKSTRTLYSGFNKGKKGLLPLGLPTNATTATILNPSKPASKAVTKNTSTKSSKIIAKRQHTPMPKKLRARR